MYLQMTWMGRGTVTLVAFVSHFSTVSTKCKQCDVASSRTKHLRIHLKMYSGEKSNKCNQCDYAFSQISNLKIHLKTHSGEKSNKCNSNLTILCCSHLKGFSPEWMQSHIGCICLAFLHCVFSNVSSNGLYRRMHNHIGCICLSFLHCVFSNVSIKT